VDHIEQLIVDLKDRPEREIGNLGQTMREGFTQVTNRFDDQGARLDCWEAELRERLARLRA
jgi:hypothetical protein